MKNSVFFLLLLIIVATSLAGCTGGGLPGPAKTTVPTPQVTTTVIVIVPETTTAVPAPVMTTAAATAPPASPSPSLASSDEIRNHFIDVAYASTSRLERLDNGRSRIVISAVSAEDDDVALIESTIQDFNAASSTVKISENIKDSGSGDVQIKFLPQEGLSAVNIDQVAEPAGFYEVLTRRELYQGGVPAAKILRGTIYINANLKDGARDHVIVRSLMYQMGLTGESAHFPDSVFYAGENTNSVLTPVDKKVITMLYADEFANGMTMEDLRKVIYLP